MLMINWRDQPPSQAAMRLAAIHRDRPPVADADNGYVYLMGFGVAPNADPHEAGVRRIEWLRNVEKGNAALKDGNPIRDDTGYRSTRPSAAEAISKACGAGWRECSIAFEGKDDVLREWMRSEQWLLDRYLTLLRHPGWLETAP